MLDGEVVTLCVKINDYSCIVQSLEIRKKQNWSIQNLSRDAAVADNHINLGLVTVSI